MVGETVVDIVCTVLVAREAEDGRAVVAWAVVLTAEGEVVNALDTAGEGRGVETLDVCLVATTVVLKEAVDEVAPDCSDSDVGCTVVVGTFVVVKSP